MNLLMSLSLVGSAAHAAPKVAHPLTCATDERVQILPCEGNPSCLQATRVVDATARRVELHMGALAQDAPAQGKSSGVEAGLSPIDGANQVTLQMDWRSPIPMRRFHDEQARAGFAEWSCSTLAELALSVEGRDLRPPAGPGASAPRWWVESDGAWLSWWEPQGDEHRLQLARYADQQWSGPFTVTLTDAAFVNWADTPAVARGGDQALYATWPERSGEGQFAYGLRWARSVDQGVSWSAPAWLHEDRSPTEHGFASLVPGDDGVVALWLDGRATAGDGPMQLRSAALSEGVGPETLLDERVCDCCNTAAVGTPEGVLAAWRDRSEAEVRDHSVARMTSQGWRPQTSLSRDDWTVAGCPVNGPALTARRDAVSAAWYTAGGGQGEVRVAHSVDGGATFSGARSAGSPAESGPSLGRVDLVSSPTGALLSWMDPSGDQAILRARALSPDGRAGPIQDLATLPASRQSGFPRLGVQDEQLLVAWTALEGEDTRLSVRSFPLSSFPAPDQALPEPYVTAEVALSRKASLQDYTARDMQGEPQLVAPLVTGPTLVALWGTWCPPCRRELPLLAALPERYPQLQLLTIAVDDRPERITSLLGELDLDLHVLLDSSTSVRKRFEVNEVPSLFLYDESGTLVWMHQGELKQGDTELQQAVEALLEGRKTPQP